MSQLPPPSVQRAFSDVPSDSTCPPSTDPVEHAVADHLTVVATPVAAGDLPLSPPGTLRAIRRRCPWLAPACLAVFVLLGLAAALYGGTALVWDRPITNACVTLRSPWIDRFALWTSRAGLDPCRARGRRCRSPRGRPALPLDRPHHARHGRGAAARRVAPQGGCRAGRGRPAPGSWLAPGYSYPSGHVLAAAATWAFVPVIVGLYVHRRWLWRTLTTLAASVIVLVAWSRVWLGVHWTSDVIGSLALAFLALSAAETAIASRAAGPQEVRPPVGRRPVVAHKRRVRPTLVGKLSAPAPKPTSDHVGRDLEPPTSASRSLPSRTTAVLGGRERR